MEEPRAKLRIGVLAIQGAFFEHRAALTKALNNSSLSKDFDLEVRDVKESYQLNDLNGLILPGGESTTMSLFLQSSKFEDVLKKWITSKENPKVVWGTCAGLILLSNNIEGQKQGGQSKIGGIDVTTSRNFFGRQVNSFEAKVKLHKKLLNNSSAINKCTDSPDSIASYHGVFIRAPAVVSVDNPKVEILATIDWLEREEPVVVGVSQDNLIGTAFHPELTEDTRWHEYFLRQIVERTNWGNNTGVPRT
ncbi:pyridoxal 5'-phosphate synthase subunit PdxT-like [Montipora capricornis]|uniref:pyridoxal 5'-phosphate synthase subunit PdxT-like n=1 Tax=Montipora capricornis TaxID=246305 RepID=UPI0035F2161B